MYNFISIYTVIFLITGLLGYSITASEDIYYINPLNAYNIINMLIYIAIIYICLIKQRKYKLVPIKYKINKINNYLLAFMIVLNLVLIYGTVYGNYTSWRYSSSAISVGTDIIKVIFVLAPAILLIVGFYCMFFIDDVSGIKVRITIGMCVLGSLLSSTGIAPMLFVMLITFNFLFPRTLRKSIFKDYAHLKTKNLKQNKLKILFLCLLFSVISIGALIYGISIKTETDVRALLIGFDHLVANYLEIEYLIGRFSVNFYSYLTSVEYIRNVNETELIQNTISPLQNMLYRFNVLLGNFIDIQRMDDGSFSRMNYKLVTLDAFNVREGTSPGLFASFTYISPPPVSYILFYFFISALMRLNLVIKSRIIGRLSFTGELVLFFYLSDILKSPFDFLLIADDNFIFLVIIIFVVFFTKKRCSIINSAKKITI